MLEEYFSEFDALCTEVTNTLDELNRSNEPITAEQARQSNVDRNLRELKRELQFIEI